MEGKAKMAGVRLEEIELMEAWSDQDEEVRARFEFPLTAATGCTSCSVIYYVIEPGHRTPTHIHSCEEIQGIFEGRTEVTVGDQTQTFEAEALVVVPALTKHTLKNVGETPLRVVGFFSSAAAIHTYDDTLMPFDTDLLVTPTPEDLRLPH
ncbi:MAG: cupin domain-containing protein [Actinomycetota bacterium]|nr:cupin domain-containing protein [Actinomycetota bacterium]